MTDVAETLYRELAERLFRAETTCTPTGLLTAEHPELDMPTAYRVQEALVALKLAQGARVVGRKAGFTSRAMQEQMGVHEPNYGCLLDSMLAQDQVDTRTLIHPRIEPEVAFILGEDLAGPGVTPLAALAATRWICPALEVVDTRYPDYRFTVVDNTADNSSAARVVLGETLYPPHGLDLRLVGAVLEVNGRVVHTGAGAAALGHPARAVAWIANALAVSGGRLRRGDIVITGGLTAAPRVQAGDTVTAIFDRLGAVSVKFV